VCSSDLPDEVAGEVIRIWVANVKKYGPLMVALKTCECVTSEGKARPAVSRCTGSTSGRAGAIRLLLELANGLAAKLRAVGSGALVKDGELSEDLLYAIIHRAMRLFLESMFIDQATHNGRRLDSPVGVDPA
jgi:hypothetical protein